MSVVTILLIVLLVMIILSFPGWNHSRSWGYGPSGILGIILVILLVLALTGNLGRLHL